MVKVIIMTDGKVIEKEGEFFFGFTTKEVDNDGVLTDSAIIGEMNPNRIPNLLSDASVEAIMRLHEGDVLDRADALIQLDQYTNNSVKKKIVSDYGVLSDAISEMLKDMANDLGRD